LVACTAWLAPVAIAQKTTKKPSSAKKATAQHIYQDIDALIETKSMVDAKTAIKKLKENYLKDTIQSEYWVRYSKASYIVYDYENAKSSIDKAITLNPNNPEYYYEESLLHNQLEELGQALYAVEKAVSLNPIGKYYCLKGMVNQQLKKTEDAENDYQNALDKKFERPDLYYNFAIILSQNQKYEKALDMVNKAINLNNKYAEAYSLRSMIHFFLLNTDAACSDKNMASELGDQKAAKIPDYICNGTLNEKLQFMADNFAGNNFFTQAIIPYSKLIDNNVLKSDNFLNRGYCYYKSKDFEKAEKDYLKALTLPDPNLDLIYDNLSLLYFDIRDLRKTIEYATKRIELNPKNHVPYIDRGTCYRQLKEYEKAEKDFNTSLEIKPDFFRAFGYRAFLFLELGQFRKSFEDASKSIEINPGYGYGYIILGQAKQELGMPDFCVDFYNAKKYEAQDADMLIEEHCK
jgi:tetratricopeptide (TPR) repeat protein